MATRRALIGRARRRRRTIVRRSVRRVRRQNRDLASVPPSFSGNSNLAATPISLSGGHSIARTPVSLTGNAPLI
jgi:hypothetical protein